MSLKWVRILKMHIGGVWDIFVCVTETASVITTCIDTHMAAEGAASSVGVSLSSEAGLCAASLAA